VPVRLAPYVGDREAQVDQAVAVGDQRRVVERGEQRAGDDMRLLVAALPRPRMQRQQMLLGRPVVGGRIAEPRLAERDVRKRRIALRLVIDTMTAQRGRKAAVGNQRVMDRGAQRGGS
jgi:hypothetical protein